MKKFKEEDSEEEEKQPFTNPTAENNFKLSSQNFSSSKLEINEEKPKLSEKEPMQEDILIEKLPINNDFNDDKPSENNFNKNNNEPLEQPTHFPNDTSKKENIFNKNSFFSKK
jgi:hypothetical protein